MNDLRLVAQVSTDTKSAILNIGEWPNQERVAVEAGAGEVIEDRARLLEFKIGP